MKIRRCEVNEQNPTGKPRDRKFPNKFYPSRSTNFLFARHPNVPSSRPENLIYLLSLALATFSLVFAIYPQFLFVYANVAAFAITVPYHTALFLSQRLPTPRRRAPWAFILLGIWIFVVAIDMLAGAPHSALPFQIVVSTVFGGLECVVVGFIAFRCVGEIS